MHLPRTTKKVSVAMQLYSDLVVVKFLSFKPFGISNIDPHAGINTNNNILRCYV